ESFLDESDIGLDSAFQQLAFHISRFAGVVLLLVTSEDLFRMQLLPQEFARLTKFLVLFDRPTPEQRQALWRSALPSRVPLAEDVDFKALGTLELDADGIASAAFRACAAAVLRPERALVQLEDLTAAAAQEQCGPQGQGRNCSKDEPVLSPKKDYTESEKVTLSQIFLQHAVGNSLPVTPWYSAARSVANAFPEKLGSLDNHAILGRVFQMIDADHDGMLDETEFVEGLYSLLYPKDAEAHTLAQRIAKGIIATPSNDFKNVKTVAILGAGVAGLQTARHLKEIGLECTIFEKEEDIGGVWRQNYADFGLQVPKELYEFPDFPYPEDFRCQDFPTGAETQAYIQLYAKTFKLYELVRFKTFIREVRPAGSNQRGWTILWKTAEGADKSEAFDFLVMATGMYGWPPHLPVARNSRAFKGQILHSCTFTDRKMAEGKKVIVVGGGKSAIDNAVAAAKEGISSTLVCRQFHWPVPRLLLNAVPFKYGTYSRFGHWMLTPHHEEGPVAKWFHGTCAPVKWIWWRVVELMFRGQFQLPSEMVPPDSIDIDLFSGGQILNYEFRDMVQEGKIKVIQGAIDSFTPEGVVLTNGTQLHSDLVIYGTGFAKNYDIFDKVLQEKLNIQKDGLFLYRNMLPPRLPDLAFVGCEVSTSNNILTHGLQALWLSKVLKGEIHLPAPGAMDKVIEKERAWKRLWMPPMSSRASIWQLHMMKYHDMLVGDMNLWKFRKMPNCFGELFMPYHASEASAKTRSSRITRASSRSEPILKPESCVDTWTEPSSTEPSSTEPSSSGGGGASFEGFVVSIWYVFEEEFLRKHRYKEISSFHTIYMLTEERAGRRSWKGCEKLCWRIRTTELERLFIPILTLDGIEGSYPEMFDQHPKNMGLCFAMASNGYDLLLVEAQDRLASNDLEGSMYFSGTGGMRPGHLLKLEPVASSSGPEARVLLLLLPDVVMGQAAGTQCVQHASCNCESDPTPIPVEQVSAEASQEREGLPTVEPQTSATSASSYGTSHITGSRGTNPGYMPSALSPSGLSYGFPSEDDPLACGTRLSELMEQENSEQTDGGSPKSNLGTPGIKSVTFDNSAAVSDYHRPKISKTLTEAHRNVLDCDLDLLRGIPLRRTLRQGGHVWRSKPREMKASERMKFYSQSKPTTSIDIFFSHTWLTDGKWKALSLLLESNQLTVVVAWAVAALTAFFLCLFEVLPMPFIYVAEFTDSHNVETEVECPLGFWVMALGMIASIWCPLIMAHLPELPEICCSEACFVDVCCIHQADEKLMQRGIYGIGGILSVSRELRVLWSAPYLSRLWCVFELAAFRKASPQGKITLSPLFIEAAVACVWILFYVTSTISLISFTYSGESAEYVGIFLNTIPVLVAAHILRVNFLSKHKLLSDLETFDLSTTECSSDSDREFISRAITKWYGSSADFTAFVQDDLRRELVTPILSSSMPLVYYLFIITPKLAANLEILLALLRGGVPGESIAAHAMGALLGYCSLERVELGRPIREK
ncbi:Probable flavin-containing monooxygenase 1, partial [Durusdinium trenchii]